MALVDTTVRAGLSARRGAPGDGRVQEEGNVVGWRRRRASRRRPAGAIPGFLLLLALSLAPQTARRLAAQAAPGRLDIGVFQQQADGSVAPLAGAHLLLSGVFGERVAEGETGADGHATVQVPEAVYELTVFAGGVDGVASQVCGESNWNYAAAKVARGANQALSDATLLALSGQTVCREFLFAPAAPPPPARPVHLTFDDGYVNLCATVNLVNSLGVRATFFLTGQVMLTFPDCVRQLVATGNLLANHSYAHENLTRLSYQGVINTLQRTENAALSVAGVSTKPYCRPPYGAINATVRRAAADFGCTMVLWDRDTLDWARRPAASIINTSLAVGCNGEVILLHTQGFPQDQFAVPTIVKTLQERGCSLTNLGE